MAYHVVSRGVLWCHLVVSGALFWPLWYLVAAWVLWLPVVAGALSGGLSGCVRACVPDTVSTHKLRLASSGEESSSPAEITTDTQDGAWLPAQQSAPGTTSHQRAPQIPPDGTPQHATTSIYYQQLPHGATIPPITGTKQDQKRAKTGPK